MVNLEHMKEEGNVDGLIEIITQGEYAQQKAAEKALEDTEKSRQLLIPFSEENFR